MPLDFALFDTRHYETLSVEDGYREWSQTYDENIDGRMDIALLARLQRARFADAKRALDLACGTGRIGAWLRAQGIARVDGVDLTDGMIAHAERRPDTYASLTLADVRKTGLDARTYDLLTFVLADEHLPDLAPLYIEAARIADDGARFVVLGYHPHFLLRGIPTHFERPSGESVAVRCHVHLFSDHVKAATGAGWSLIEMDERVVDDEWVAGRANWKKHHHRPVTYAAVWGR